MANSSQSTRRRWAVRGLAASVLAAPLLAVGVAQAQAAELAPIAEDLDEAVAGTSETVVDTVAAALGVELDD